MSDTADVLRKAKQVLIDDGWTQGTDEDACGRHCIVGAIAKASPGAARVWPALDLIANVAQVHSVVRWNDAPGRAESHVLAAFDAAIALAEAEA